MMLFNITSRFWCNKNGLHKKNRVSYLTNWKFTIWIVNIINGLEKVAPSKHGWLFWVSIFNVLKAYGVYST